MYWFRIDTNNNKNMRIHYDHGIMYELLSIEWHQLFLSYNMIEHLQIIVNYNHFLELCMSSGCLMITSEWIKAVQTCWYPHLFLISQHQDKKVLQRKKWDRCKRITKSYSLIFLNRSSSYFSLLYNLNDSLIKQFL